MNQHFTILLSVTESYRRIIIHYFLENYSEEAIDFIDAITTDIAANSISSAEQNIIVLCDSDLSISRFQNTGYPVIACSHENNTEESLMGVPWLILSPESLTPDFLEEVFCRHHHIPLTIVCTNRCVVRELAPEDLSFLLQLQKENEENPDGCFFPVSCDSPDSFLLEYIKNQYPFYGYGLYAILEKESAAFLGIAGFSTPSAESEGKCDIEISYALLKKYQHQGYMTEVLKSLIHPEKENGRFEQIIARIHRSNKASIHLAKKLDILIVLT